MILPIRLQSVQERRGWIPEEKKMQKAMDDDRGMARNESGIALGFRT